MKLSRHCEERATRPTKQSVGVWLVGLPRLLTQARNDIVIIVICAVLFIASHTYAAELDTKQPIDITADALEVRQEEQIAVFTGNVLARQGDVNMKAAQMVVHYRSGGASDNNVSKIEATGNVLFTTPTETAQGKRATYNVDQDMIYLREEVVLTREQNILKGSELEYNLATGRSIVTGSGATVSGQKTGNGRVRGVFVPGNK